MKGKFKNLKYVFALVLFLTAGVCFAFNTITNSEQVVYAAHNIFTVGTGIEEKKFSAKFAGDAIFSVEKVKVSSVFNQYGMPTEIAGTSFDGGLQELWNSENEKIEKFNVKYTFDADNKEVAEDGKFLRFDNIIDGSGVVQTKDDPNVQEATIVSFGAYVYDADNETVDINNKDTEDTTDDVYSKITYLEVVAYHNNKEIETPKIRNINTGDALYFDFTQIILQNVDNSNEGYYQYSVRYMVDFVEYVENFSFYLVNNTSYTTILNSDYGYSALPTLGWTDDAIAGGEFAKTANAGDYVRYKIGQNGVYNQTLAYPTITYDYTRFSLSYVHNANQKNVTYTYDIEYQNKINGQTASLVCTIDNGNEIVTKTQELNDYNENAKTNLLTIMLTEPGTYVANYEYLYRGYNSESAPQTGFKTSTIRLSIHGFNTYYTKANVEGARLQYYTIATKLDNSVDLFIPNGYEYSETNFDPDAKLGFAYVLTNTKADEDEISREGNIITSKSKDALVNYSLGADNVTYIASFVESKQITETQYNTLDNILSSLKYASTNQGSLWLEGNDTYTGSLKSFYYYSSTKITASNLFDTSYNKITDNVNEFSNTTSFNQKGYYLVFIHVIPNGDETNTYYQVFAFQYTSSAVNLTLETVEEEGNTSILEGGKFTNKDVQISWLTPGVFDRKISAYYYSATNRALDKDALLQTRKNNLEFSESGSNSVALLGKVGTDSEVANGNFVKFLIRLESEGQSATLKMFTIDRQEISGLQPYLIQEMYSGGAVFYAYATNSNHNYVPIYNAITDGYATLAWNDKASGANITAKYSYTPFVSNTDPITLKTGTNGATWLTTNYQLGTTIIGSELVKARYEHDVSTDSVLFNQGIYLFTLTDDAGNSCKYAFILDRTPNYFYVDEKQPVSNGLYLSGENVDYTMGDYKAFKLDTTASGFDKDLLEFIEKAQAGQLNTIEDYYVGTNNNTSAISKFFQKDAGNNYYFTVQNHRVEAYDTTDELDSSIKAKTGTLTYIKESGASYYKRTLYAISENHSYSIKSIKTHSYATIEINTDNALGMVYYSGGEIAQIPENGKDDDSIFRLDTGSDDVLGDGSAFAKLQATNANHLAFVWNIGTGIFEVAKVEYTYYTLDFSSYNDIYRFYKNGMITTIYDSSSSTNPAKTLGDGRMFYALNGESLTRDGLYVVTRYYKNYDSSDFGNDVGVKNYYFVVDRNGIIDLSNEIGENIKLWLKETETKYNEFSKTGVEYVSNFKFVADDGQTRTEGYNIYLKTTKLPAVMQVPVGKYFNDNGSSGNYYAGQLKVSIYFDDVKTQLPSGDEYRNKQVKIFEGDVDVDSDGYFTIDIYDYLVKNYGATSSLVGRLAMVDEDRQAWLFLSGNYVIHIRDNVKNKGLAVGYHEKFIGFQIDGVDNSGPQIDVKTGASKNDGQLLTVNISNDNATVSQEYLKVTLPAYDKNVTKYAQVDPDYLIITQIINGTRFPYLSCEYSKLSDFNRDFIVDNGYRGFDIWLDTLLRDREGKIDTDNLSRSLKYEIKFRYDLNNANGSDNERFKNCYFYYDANGNKIYYYQTTYTIEIDRQAPTTNINNLNTSDTMVNEYNQNFGTSEMFTNAVYEKSKLYFTRQYDKYYVGKLAGTVDYSKYLYIYLVNANTTFSTDDIKYVYVKSFNPVSDKLSLPFVKDGHTENSVDKTTTYGALSGITGNGYYEIVEEDFAGNITQYVIAYKMAKADMNIKIEITPTNSNIVEQEISFETNESINAFKINEVTSSTFKNDYFFKIELYRNSNLEYSWLTNTATKFESLGEDIFTKLNEVADNANGSGNFNLKVLSRTNSVNANINLYNSESIKELDIEDLVDKSTNPYTIRLNRANVYDPTQGLWFYATKITVQEMGATLTEKVYVASYSNGEISYFDEDNNNKVETIVCNNDTTYILKMETVIGDAPPYRFNSSGKEFVVVEFENDHGYKGAGNNKYYGYSSATFKYDKTVYSAEIYKKNSGMWAEFGAGTIESGNYYVLSLPEVYNDDTCKGEIAEYKVILKSLDEEDVEYLITIDKSMGAVVLKDSKGDSKDIISIYDNTAFDSDSISVRAIGSGILTLNWNEIENDYFDYVYIIHELVNPLDKNSYVKTVVTGKNVHQINTQEGSSGYYRLEVRVYEKGMFNEQDLTQNFLGNRVFAFEVKRQGGNIYFVRNSENIDMSPNSTFKIADIDDDLEEFEKIEINNAGIVENAIIDLYVSTDNLEIVTATDQVEKTKILEKDIDSNIFSLYKVAKTDGAYSIFLGILKIKESQSLVSDVKINSAKTQDVGVSTDFVLIENDSESVSISAKVKVQNSSILKKNKLFIDVYYMSKLVKSVEIKDLTGTVSETYTYNYNIGVSGKYSFVIRDLAGNVHKYANGDDALDVTLMKEKELIVSVNGQAPIKNAIYNSNVEITLYNSANYNAGSVNVTAYRNGKSYTPNGHNPTYIFTDYGTYRVIVSASLTNSEKTYQFSTILYFTILNVKEARASIDLTSLSGYSLTKVLNPDGKDVTSAFKNMMNKNINGGTNITYDNIMQNSKDLLVFSGKTEFTLTYNIEDEFYPPREMTFRFTLYDEIPKIECTLKAGESTKKTFEIFFNPSIIFEQVGEAGVYINGELVAEINADSINGEVRISRSFKTDGDGDYYISLVSSSGVVLDAYKVEIKEPLNSWAIIVIIVVVGVVATVVITIIVLRRKMRIR